MPRSRIKVSRSEWREMTANLNESRSKIEQSLRHNNHKSAKKGGKRGENVSNSLNEIPKRQKNNNALPSKPTDLSDDQVELGVSGDDEFTTEENNRKSQGENVPSDGIIVEVSANEELGANSSGDSECESDLDGQPVVKDVQVNKNKRSRDHNSGTPDVTLKKKGRYNELRSDPQFNDFINEVVEAKIQIRREREQLMKETEELEREKELSRRVTQRSKPKARNNNGKNSQGMVGDRNKNPLTPMVKSPSDTMVYMRALRQEKLNENAIDRISNFVENIRIQMGWRNWSVTPKRWGNDLATEDEEMGEEPTSTADENDDESDVNEYQENDHYRKESHEGSSCGESSSVTAPRGGATDKIIREAENHRAELSAPQGMRHMPIKIDKNIQLLRSLDNDDEFFHVSCHMEPSLKSKIEKGEYMDLDKLLPKERISGLYPLDEDCAWIELV